MRGLDVAPAGSPRVGAEQAVLASWRQLLDEGTLQRDEPALAGTARPAVVRLGKDTAVRLGVSDGDPVTVTGPRRVDHPARPDHRDARAGGLGADALPGQPRAQPASGSPPAASSPSAPEVAGGTA